MIVLNTMAFFRPALAGESTVMTLKKPSLWDFSASLGYHSFVNADKTYFGREENSQSLSSVQIGVHSQTERRHVEANLLYVQEENFGYYDISEASWLVPATEGSLLIGRHKEEWSQCDEFWMLGGWQPRFEWNPLDSHAQGFTGLFYSLESTPSLDAKLFFSGVSLPSTQPSYREENGQIVAPNPWFRKPPPIISVWDKNTNVRTSIQEPEVRALVLRPSLAFAIGKRWSPSNRTQLAYAYKPTNKFRLSYSYFMRSGPTGANAIVTVRPDLPYEHIVTTESVWSSGAWSVTPSLTYQRPEPVRNPNDWISQDWPEAATASLVAQWGDTFYGGASRQRVYMGALRVWERTTADLGEDAQTVSQFDRRFNYYGAVRAGYERRFARAKGREFLLGTEATYDRVQNGALFTSKLDYRPVRDMKIGVRVDLLGALGVAQGGYERAFLQAYRANDNMSLDLDYAF